MLLYCVVVFTPSAQMVLTLYAEESVPGPSGDATKKPRGTREKGILGRDASPMGVNKSIILAIAPKVEMVKSSSLYRVFFLLVPPKMFK